MPRVGLKGPPPQKQRGRMQSSPRRPQPRTQEPAVPKPQPLVLQRRGAEGLGWAVIRHGATNILRYLRGPRAVSSVGSEHLVYTEGVGGSSPSPPTQITPHRPLHCRGFLMPKHVPSLLECMERHQKTARPKGRGCIGGAVLDRPIRNPLRRIPKDIPHHKQAATHPNHVVFPCGVQRMGQRLDRCTHHGS